MSRLSSGSGSSYEEEEESVVFVCRKCPGLTFTAAEKDGHRLMHRREKLMSGKVEKKIKRKERRPRSPSPVPSEVTLFENPEPGVSRSTIGGPNPSKRLRRRVQRSPTPTGSATDVSRSPSPTKDLDRAPSPRTPSTVKPPYELRSTSAQRRQAEGLRRRPVKDIEKVRRRLVQGPQVKDHRAPTGPVRRSARQAEAAKEDSNAEKRKSKKNYDVGVIGYWVNGNGA